MLGNAIDNAADQEARTAPAVRILIIDDDSLVRLVLRQILEDAGYEVVEAANGSAGAALHQQRPFDLIITDMRMPGKNGLHTIQELRRDDPEATIVAISGYDPDELRQAEKLGAVRTFFKPFRREQLLESLREILGEAPPRPPQ